MRKTSTLRQLGLAALGFLPLTALHAQSLNPQQAFEKALAVRGQWAAGYAPTDLRLSNAYADANGLEHVYVQQVYRGIPVYNRVQSLAFAKGRLASHAGTFVPVKELMALPASPAISAATAVSRTLQHLAASTTKAPALLTETGGPEARQTFDGAGVARRDIVASLTWAQDDAGKPHLAWNVNIDLLNSSDWWNVRVDAGTGAIVGQDSWTVHEAAANRHRSRPATGTTSQVGFNTYAAAYLPPTTTTGTYLVVPYPRENPFATGFQTETEPWLKVGAGNSATTHGWHFDGTTNYAFTRGNNVAAYDDVARTNAPGNYAASQTPAPALSFAYTPNPTAAPSTSANRNAAIVNLFYWNNIVHDALYQYGFTEAAGNFQNDNLGRGGSGADYVKAEAQDGGGTNNANFDTPPDGVSGRMQMFLWSPADTPLMIETPTSIAGSYQMAEGAFSTNNRLANVGPVSGQVVLYTDAGSNPVTSLGCASHAGASLAGKIALIYRGSTCGFAAKVKNAQLAGAAAVIMVNNVGGAIITMGGTDNTVTIPAVMVSQDDGALIAGQLAAGVQVTLSRPSPTAPQMDGDLDNGIIVHEYGHGVSNRLTGGPSNSSCLNNAEQGGEGWSDYLALMLNTDWTNTPLTDGPRPRPVGNYADGQPANGLGIRRYAYSTSLTTNPLTYANVAATPESHAIGEIWCAALWDMTWNIIQQHGRIEPNLFNGAGNGGNNVALNLVMQGMKLQPCQPGFLDARDAILAADSLLYQGQYHCSIWRAFARRGMGYSSVQGRSTSATDQVAAFDMPPSVTMEKLPAVVQGNTFNVAIKLSCNCQVPTSSYTVTNELPAGMQFVSSSTGGTLSGTKVVFDNLTFTTPGQTQTLRFQAQASAAAACAQVLPVNDDREASTLGSFVSQPISGSTNWSVSTAHAFSGTHTWFAPPPLVPSDFVLTSAPFTPTGLSVLSFYHYFDFEATYDGGTVELSTNNGTSWQNAATYFVQNGYNSTFDASTSAPGQRCFSGRSVSGSTGFIRSVLDLRSFAGTPLRLRFRTRTDTDSPGTFEGWFIDDIQVINGCGGTQRVELLAGNTLQEAQNVLTYLLPVTTTAQKPSLAQASQFSAQPNPFGAEGVRLQLNLPAALPQVGLTLYDVTGRVLLRRTLQRVATGTSTVSWPETADLPAGLYLVRVQLPDGSGTTLRVERK
ncbi:T9SS type A sorting domain-containing protein [Hymenobacter busanensis]|uniref:T9SS type A sorting domain-containing protein n=1 Tax=Hymenobacter busanensis TaxID=2607656 RepID=A0A7L5A2I0_9BACT|nr:M36 family metallopeptidase [Hymenobacter busanensis]KAA9338251.1 T9SS type A sorting domain-containing protein [Hymenobacter busanensis]QHJ09326.1 T9SS type A sorting domain-containing protein [Hymenobacter busanensis]